MYNYNKKKLIVLIKKSFFVLKHFPDQYIYIYIYKLL